MKRAPRHRKRTAPPGPCGVLWEMSRSKVLKPKQREEEEEFTRQNEDDKGSVLFPADCDGSNLSERFFRSNKYQKNRVDDQYDASTPPAWVAMQRSLNVVTPYLPISSRGNVQRRHELLRPHLPRNCILLPEILNGGHDLKIVDPDLYLCVWVDSIEERNSHHGIWTVELKDETGAKIRAWMEPDFVKEELQKAQQAEDVSSNKGVVRVGVVWMLGSFSMIAVNNNNRNNENGILFGNNNSGVLERMLVVSGKHILRVWMPELDRVQYQPNEEEDSAEAQRNYLDWMEKRNALTVAAENGITSVNDVENEPPRNEEVEMGEEKGHENLEPSFGVQQEAHIRPSDDEESNNYHFRRYIVVGKENQERMAEMSALSMTADDDTATIISQRSRMINGGNDYFSASNDLTQLGMKTTSTLAHRNVRKIDSNGNCVENGCEINNRNDNGDLYEAYTERHQASSVLLHTQELSQVKRKVDTKFNERNDSSLVSCRGSTASKNKNCDLCSDSGHQDNQLLTQLCSSGEDRDLLCSEGISSQKHHCNQQMMRKQRKKKYEDIKNMKGLSPSQYQVMNRSSPKRNRTDWDFTCSSPIRMSYSTWNIPDPSLSEMLEDEDKDEEDNEIGAEDVKVDNIICEEAPHSSFPTRSPNKKHLILENSVRDEPETSILGEVKESECGCIEEDIKVHSNQNDDGTESLLVTKQVMLGGNLLELSNWEDVDETIFSNSDHE